MNALASTIIINISAVLTSIKRRMVVIKYVSFMLPQPAYVYQNSLANFREERITDLSRTVRQR